jgi:hypothetical protein
LENGIRLQVFVAGKPIEGACLILELPTLRKNDFSIVVGPTVADGSLFISLETLNAEMGRIAGFFPMDYAPSSWSQRVEARVMSRAEVARFLSAYKMWDTTSLYPPGQREAVEAWGSYLDEHPPFELAGEEVGEHAIQLTCM